MEKTQILKTEAEFYELLAVEEGYENTVYLNTAHIIAIAEDRPSMEVHMSNGKIYQISDNDSVRLRTYLHASKAL
ncbi:MAG: hypothetical protein LC794_01605 [Acidobacteria bacterium]|nr:hypothetical protein [Acidobacteriota bacterium]